MPSEIIKKCAKTLAEKKWNIAFAESATAGRMSAEFSLTEQSGQILRGGLTCYEVFVKEQILHVPHSYIEKFTPESKEVTQKLAEQAAKLFNTKVTVAVTGLTTPGGSETKLKPVGTMFICIITPNHTLEYRQVFEGTPEEIVLQTIDFVADHITRYI
ncbi:CinA family protein [Flavobacterium sp.]|uniref:CinA family protein n=1 Tax=Flavobacterium sp. TaxID=239 RepID=UPI002C7F2AEA|nr:CinA family protein [Flavobacterium sp.]HSD06661.1 CinA family protein [Flavobacterium sp.]